MIGKEELQKYRKNIKSAALQHEDVSIVSGSLRLVVDADRDLAFKILVAVDGVLKREIEGIEKIYQQI